MRFARLQKGAADGDWHVSAYISAKQVRDFCKYGRQLAGAHIVGQACVSRARSLCAARNSPAAKASLLRFEKGTAWSVLSPGDAGHGRQARPSTSGAIWLARSTVAPCDRL